MFSSEKESFFQFLIFIRFALAFDLMKENKIYFKQFIRERAFMNII
jgi:hypothetical protein